ncbi:Gamma-aminobutyric acid type B receptor subunit 2, partial [Fragariocoptes setiger]
SVKIKPADLIYAFLLVFITILNTSSKQEKDVRIILGNFDEQWAIQLFCEAFRAEMTGRKYQWILTGISEEKLWQQFNSSSASCAREELLVAMDGYIITDITPVTSSQKPTISGLKAHEYFSEYKKRSEEMNVNIVPNKFYGYVYDGVWAIALALNSVDYRIKQQKSSKSLLDFDYRQPSWAHLIRSALNKTKFPGVTGTVSFRKNERPGLITFRQFQVSRDVSEVTIGSYDALNEILDLNVGFPISWRGPTPPIDHTIQKVIPSRVNRGLFVIISVLSILGIILACIFLAINIKYRNQRYIKMSSPYLNNLIIIGCVLTYTSVILLGLDSGLTSESNFPYICAARAWVLMSGFTLAFGSMFSKTFRVHSIFTNIKLHKKVIKDYKLFLVVGILLTVDIITLTTWQIVDPFYRETNNGTGHLIELKQNPKAGDQRVRATLKAFKKNSYEASNRSDINNKIRVMMDENVRQRQVLKEKTYELEALVFKLRKLQSLSLLSADGQSQPVQSMEKLAITENNHLHHPPQATVPMHSNLLTVNGSIAIESNTPTTDEFVITPQTSRATCDFDLPTTTTATTTTSSPTNNSNNHHPSDKNPVKDSHDSKKLREKSCENHRHNDYSNSSCKRCHLAKGHGILRAGFLSPALEPYGTSCDLLKMIDFSEWSRGPFGVVVPRTSDIMNPLCSNAPHKNVVKCRDMPIVTNDGNFASVLASDNTTYGSKALTNQKRTTLTSSKRDPSTMSARIRSLHLSCMNISDKSKLLHLNQRHQRQPDNDLAEETDPIFAEPLESHTMKQIDASMRSLSLIDYIGPHEFGLVSKRHEWLAKKSQMNHQKVLHHHRHNHHHHHHHRSHTMLPEEYYDDEHYQCVNANCSLTLNRVNQSTCSSGSETLYSPPPVHNSELCMIQGRSNMDRRRAIGAPRNVMSTARGVKERGHDGLHTSSSTCLAHDFRSDEYNHDLSTSVSAADNLHLCSSAACRRQQRQRRHVFASSGNHTHSSGVTSHAVSTNITNDTMTSCESCSTCCSHYKSSLLTQSYSGSRSYTDSQSCSLPSGSSLSYSPSSSQSRSYSITEYDAISRRSLDSVSQRHSHESLDPPGQVASPAASQTQDSEMQEKSSKQQDLLGANPSVTRSTARLSDRSNDDPNNSDDDPAPLIRCDIVECI